VYFRGIKLLFPKNEYRCTLKSRGALEAMEPLHCGCCLKSHAFNYPFKKRLPQAIYFKGRRSGFVESSGNMHLTYIHSVDNTAADQQALGL
jgi:hypothetical protein